MRQGWKKGSYNSTRRQVGVIEMGTSYGMMHGDKFTASSSTLGVRMTGFDSHESAQEALEAEVEKKLEAAIRALRVP
jgi:hypothetical protein